MAFNYAKIKHTLHIIRIFINDCDNISPPESFSYIPPNKFPKSVTATLISKRNCAKLISEMDIARNSVSKQTHLTNPSSTNPPEFGRPVPDSHN